MSELQDAAFDFDLDPIDEGEDEPDIQMSGIEEERPPERESETLEKQLEKLPFCCQKREEIMNRLEKVREKESIEDIRSHLKKSAFASTIHYFATDKNTDEELDINLRRISNFVQELNVHYKNSELIKPFDENLLPPKELMEGKDCMIFSKIAFEKIYKSLFMTRGRPDPECAVVDYKDIAYLFNKFFFVVTSKTKKTRSDIYHYFLPDLQVITRQRGKYQSQFPSVQIVSTDGPNLRNMVGMSYNVFLCKEEMKYHYFKKEGCTYFATKKHLIDLWIGIEYKRQADQFAFDTFRPWGFCDLDEEYEGPDLKLKLDAKSFNTYQGNQWARDLRRNPRSNRKEKEEEEINEFLHMFQTYMFMALCSGNEKHATFLYSWILRVLFEKPKTEIMVTLISKPEGTGKSTLSNIMTVLMGTTLSVQAPRQVFSHKFTGPIFENTRLLYVDEESNYHETSKFDKTSQDNLKSIMTAPTLMVEGKHSNLDKKVINNDMNVLSTTNNLSPSYIKSESDNRRYFVLEVSTYLHQKEDFWTKFYDYYDKYMEYIWDYLYTLYIFEVFPFPRAIKAEQTYALALAMLRTMPLISGKWSSFLARKEIGNSYEKYRRDLTRKFDDRFCLRLSLAEIMEELDNKDAITVATFLNEMFVGGPLFQVNNLNSLKDLPSYDNCVDIFCRFQQVNKDNYLQYISCQQLETVSKKRSLEQSRKEASKSKQKRKVARKDKQPADPTQRLLFDVDQQCQSDVPK